MREAVIIVKEAVIIVSEAVIIVKEAVIIIWDDISSCWIWYIIEHVIGVDESSNLKRQLSS